MKLVAQVTALIFIVLGFVVIVLGGYIALAKSSIQVTQPAGQVPGLFDFSGVITLAKLLVGGGVALQGLFLAAIGEALWLLAEIAAKTGQASDSLSALMQRRR